MKIVRSLARASAAVACGALVLSLVGGDAMAARKPQPPVSLFWPSGAQVETSVVWGFGALHVSWPIANGADHYRLTVVEKVRRGSTVVYDQSPAYYAISSDGWAYNTIGGIIEPWPGVRTTYTITLTAYSGADEGAAYSESLQTEIVFR